MVIFFKMSKNIAPVAKKTALLAQKEKLLKDIKYYEQRINEFPTSNSSFYYDGDGSSDSEESFPALLNIGPSLSELQTEEKSLQTCLQATQELTNLTVLQSEMNIMVQDPVLEGKRPITEPGSWREIAAECRIDLVPFSITFYTHQPSRKFSPTSFHGLHVIPVKVVHEAELSKSVLIGLTKPSDAIEVFRSYAVAYRSRRTTLARLADRYANNLLMEPLAEGGFVLKCANLLEMSWRLENKTSPLAPFKHKMNFELDYMDESYLKIIKQAHRQLSDPSLTTDERTLLLSKIISTCLEAQTPTQELYESMESDQESMKKLEKTTLDTDDDVDEEPKPKQTRDEDIMAPPKALPKKTKPKGKENKDENRKSVKRGSSQVEVGNAKKAKTDTVTDLVRNIDNNNEGNTQNNGKVSENVEKQKSQENIDKLKDNAKNVAKVAKKVGENDAGSSKSAVKNTEKQLNDERVTKNDKMSKNNEAKSSKTTKITETTNKNANNDEVAKNVPSKKVIDSAKAKNVAGNPKVANKVVDNEKNAKIKQKNNTDPTNNKEMAKNTENIKHNKKGEKAVDSKNDKNNKQNNVEKIRTENKEKPKSSDSKTANNNAKSKEGVKDQPVKDNNTELTKVKNSTNVDPSNTKKSAKTDQKETSEKSSKGINVAQKNKNPSNEVTKRPTMATSNSENNFKVPKDAIKKGNVASKDPKKINVASNDPKNGNVANNIPNKGNVASNIPKKGNVASNDPKKGHVASNNLEKDIGPSKNFHNQDNKLKNHENKPKTQENKPKNLVKSKLAVKSMSHRNSMGKPKKTITSMKIMKPDANNESGKNSRKKLSPAYAAVLEQNPIRMSPRMMSKFKSSSDSNIQMKLFKPTSNIPRLLKKPAPKSK